MKRIMSISLAILLALALSVAAITEESVNGNPDVELAGMDGLDVSGQADGGEGLDLDNLLSGDLLAQDGGDYVAVYRFIVDGEEYAVREVRNGEKVFQPEAPAAPEGMTFVGWVLENDAPLFVDADADGETDPVIACVNGADIEVNVWASFAEIPPEVEPVTPAPAADGAEEGETPDGEPASPEGEAQDPPAVQQPVEQPESQPVEQPEGQPMEQPEGQPMEQPEGQPVEQPEGQPEEQPEGQLNVQPMEEITVAAPPVANALVYTGEAQPLVSAEGGWLYSLDGVNYTEAIPAAVDSGEYTVYYKAAEDAEAQTLAVMIEKADVTFDPPVAATGEIQ